jgi:hypothetical protein
VGRRLAQVCAAWIAQIGEVGWSFDANPQQEKNISEIGYFPIELNVLLP